uniref:PLDc_N domain-containing protein n=1 Tax=Rhabditophanes sp. KR3021 TaxID=114890 RepID=A0AC35TZ50_9BILA
MFGMALAMIIIALGGMRMSTTDIRDFWNWIIIGSGVAIIVGMLLYFMISHMNGIHRRNERRQRYLRDQRRRNLGPQGTTYYKRNHRDTVYVIDVPPPPRYDHLMEGI